MNALTACFPYFKGQSFKPNWKTLTVVDQDGRWFGRVMYVRAPNKQHTQLVSTAGDWECHILIPAELADRILTTAKHDRSRRDSSEEIEHHELMMPPGPGKCLQTSKRWIITVCIGAGRI